MATRLITVITLKCVKISNHYVVQQELTQHGRSIILQNKPTNRLTEDKVSSVVNRGSGESDERCQKVQTSGSTINRHNDL